MVGTSLTAGAVGGLVVDLVVDDLREGDREQVGAARGDQRRRELLEPERVLAEAVVVVVDLPRALGGDHDELVAGAVCVGQQLVDAGLVH
jgi:hypothetical protein